MLRKIRLTFAILFFAFVTLLFLDFTGTVHAWLGWMAKVQFLPAVMALNVGIMLLLVALTLIAGRVYCSVICPLGVFQDIVSRISGMRRKKKYRFTYSPALSWLRYGVLAVFVVALLAGMGSVVSLLDPYGSYGRIASNLFVPFYGWGNNVLAYLAERADSYAFYETTVWLRSLPTFLVAVATFVILVVLAWRNGRTYCNTICPVGTVLGLLSRYSLFRVTIDPGKCEACSLCARRCKAACIDYRNHRIDYGRCVSCMDCIDACKRGAVKYRLRYGHSQPVAKEASAVPPEDPSGRRSFLTATALLATSTLMAQEQKKVDGGLAVIEKKLVPTRQTPVLPPGSHSARHFARHCTACQLCVSVCPNEVLRPSTALGRFMQPEMSYERGYCRPECNRCAEVCPTGAIRLADLAEKSSTQIGHAVWVKQNCVPLTDGVECGNCARHCPTGAIQMVASDPDNPDSPKIPVVNEARCIGCGACENLCPSRPFSAIYVEGHEIQQFI